ncbi:hypothetical protein BDQ12DRAFT_727398 [Crucibulum laeve]|uniref:Uncharacterized protein n=1 Tax=Crucibulum laeve TaxID=68775 RepID=A0A5C3LMF2_9AGAR|nr:hypothetical protein BDQ12DRAFT_727398 [Crucibulum laeve]
MSAQCALKPDGQLKDANDIKFFLSESDERPIEKPDLRRGSRVKKTQKLTESLAKEHLNEFGQPLKAKSSVSHHQRRPKTAKKPKLASTLEETLSNLNDSDFEIISSDESSSSDSEEDIVLSNTEIAQSLSSKTIPTTGRGSGKRKRKQSRPVVEEVEDEDSARKISERSLSPSSSFVIEDAHLVNDSSSGKTKKIP